METKEAWIVASNTDLTEGRGDLVRLAFCETYATARRLGRGKYVQGGDCPVSRVTLYKPESKSGWFGPITLRSATEADLKNQKRLDEMEAAIDKAKSLGLTEDEIDMIRKT